jgi:cobalt-zinc-cadmium efflux system membrane fusion protein
MKTKNIIRVVWVLAILFACETKGAEKNNTNTNDLSTLKCLPKQVSSIGVEVADVVWKERSGTLNVNGIIDVPPGNKSFISLPYGGYIKKMNVIEGKRVSKGEILFEVQHPDVLLLQQEFLELEGRMEFLEGELSRQLKMESGNATSQKNVQAARSELNVSKAKLKGITARLKLANVDVKTLRDGKISESQPVRAPFNGVVTKITTGVGSFVNPQDNLMEIIDLKHTHAELTVFEKDISRLKIGQAVDVYFLNNSSLEKASIYLIGGEIAADRSVKVHCHFDEQSKSNMPGAYFKAKIHTDAKKTRCLPSAAFVSVGANHYVFHEARLNEFNLVEVKILGEADGETSFEFIGAIPNSKRFVTKGAFELLSLLNKSSE